MKPAAVAVDPRGLAWVRSSAVQDRPQDGGESGSTVVALMAARARNDRGPMRALTDRQHEVLVLMAQGRSNGSIARTLSVSERAVIQHVSHIYEQLGLPVSDDDHRRVLAVIRYLAGLPAA
ncbi:MAG: two component transcriptional regulator, LuxR family [Actinomycetia bacterium]|nr:two component transcriptional regulator, LuxR family [Actinomycetes bacterium]